MTGQVLVVASGKGGVGKTATAVNLAVSFRLQDRSVVLVDGDLGMPNVVEWFSIDRGPTVHDVLAGTAEPYDAVLQEAEGFGILPGDHQLDGYADADPSRFAYVIDRLAKQYDHVIVDTGGGLSYENALPLRIADEIILVTSPNPSAIKDTKRTKGLVDLIEGNIRGVVVMKADYSTDAEEIAADIGVDLLGTVPFDRTIDESIAEGVPLEMHDPDSLAAEAFRKLGAVLLNEEEPLTRNPVDGD